MTLDEAMKRIAELERQVADLTEEVEDLRSRKLAGRRRHDDKWMQSYNDFVSKFEKGMSMTQIVACSEYSRRTAYRYKTYYEEIHGKREKAK